MSRKRKPVPDRIAGAESARHISGNCEAGDLPSCDTFASPANRNEAGSQIVRRVRHSTIDVRRPVALKTGVPGVAVKLVEESAPGPYRCHRDRTFRHALLAGFVSGACSSIYVSFSLLSRVSGFPKAPSTGALCLFE